MLTSTRQPAVAGLFYPSDPAELTAQINRFLQAKNAGEQGSAKSTAQPRAIIVPHAGYIYSGIVAAAAFARLNPSHSLTRVVLLGPAHSVYLQGCAIPEAKRFATPLGELDIDQSDYDKLSRFDEVSISDIPHRQEHCLEVQLPFLQLCLGQFTLLPIVVGDTRPHVVADILELFWQEENSLIVVSSDLSHYHPYDEACRLDEQTCQQILDLSTQVLPQQACGCHAINGLTLLARRHELEIHRLSYRNSGDTAGDKHKVVGYASFALY